MTMYKQVSLTVWCCGYTHLVVAVGALLLALWGSRLRRAVGPILLSLPLRIVGILSWGTLGRTYDKKLRRQLKNIYIYLTE